MKNYYLKKSARFNAPVVRFCAFTILAILVASLLPALAHNPDLILGLGMVLPIGRGLQFLEFEGRGGSGSVMSPELFQSKVLFGVDGLTAKMAEKDSELQRLRDEVAEMRTAYRRIAKASLGSGNSKSVAIGSVVSDDCAKVIGAIGFSKALSKGLSFDNTSEISRIVSGILGKAALTTGDIPLPVEYSVEIVELVSKYGSARKFGTVFPLPGSSVKLPKLKTEPTFGLIAMSGAVGQVSPQFDWVTFNAEKWGGLILLPNEINEDSMVAIGQFIARYAARQLAKLEDVVFFAADGTATYDNLEGLTKSVVTDSKTVALASTKTKYSDLTMAKFRELRSTVDSAALGDSKYYLHSTFEQLLASFNTAGDKPYMANGIKGASFDGFGIEWVDALPAYSTSTNASVVSRK